MKSRNLPGEGDYSKELLDADYYEAKCFLVAAVGTQPAFMEGVKGKPKAIFGFEFEEIKNEDGTPRVIFLEVNDSLHELSTMRGYFNTWLGSKGNPFTDERAKNCDLSLLAKNGIRARLNIIVAISKKDKEYNRIEGILPTKFPKSVSEPVSRITIFDIYEPVKEEFEALTKYHQGLCEKADEWHDAAITMGLVDAPTQPNQEFTNSVTPEQQKTMNESTSASNDDDDLPF